MAFTTQDIRNIAVTGHGGTGKTSFVERVLFDTGVIPRMETTDSGRTASDYTEEEIERKMSIHTSLTHVEWEGKKINILDTPGAGDFVGEVAAALRAAETALVFVSADTGVQIETIKVWRRLNAMNKPRIVFINKMDKDRADFKKCFDDLKAKFGATFVPVTASLGAGAGFKGIVNLIENKAYFPASDGKKETAGDIPAGSDEIAAFRSLLVESAAEGSDELIEKYFAEGTLSDEEIRLGLKKGLAANKVVPVICGSVEKNSGIAALFSFITTDAPSPEGVVFQGKGDKGAVVEVPVNSTGNFSAFVFRTSIDQFSGKLSFLKVVTGHLKPDLSLTNVREGRSEKAAKIYTCQGKKLEESSEFCAGDIAVLTKLTTVHTNDTIGVEAHVQYEALALPNPVHSVAVNAASKKEEDKLNESIQRFAEEDLTFRVSYNKETKETVISGMGELHLSMILGKIKDKQKIEIQTHVPKIAYRETITKPGDAEYTHKKQSGGHGQYGKVAMIIRPLPRGDQYAFSNDIKGGAISKGYIPGIEKGVVEAMESGVVAGYPVVDVASSIIDGKEHPVDSSEMAFKIAGRGAFREAMKKANPVLLEPVMNLEVYVDEQYMGDILSDLSSKRGKVQGQEQLGGGITSIKAQVPHAELLKYAIDLKSMTSGTGSYEMSFDHYSPITGKIAEEVIKAAEAHRVEEKDE